MDKPADNGDNFSATRAMPRAKPIGSVWNWLDERLGLHTLHYEVPPHANSILYTLGGVTLLGFLMVGITGFFMTQFYHPHPVDARGSIIYMVTRVSFGEFARGVHFWGANLVVITMSLHVLRVFISGTYKRPRELNWVIGVSLLALTMAFFFTGTVLKWDQEAYEALQHQEAIARLLSGVGTVATTDFTRSVPLLTRLYLVHTSILAIAFFLLLAVHLFLVKYLKISPLPRRGRPSEEYAGATSNGEKSYFSAHVKDMAGYGMMLGALLSVLALAFPAVLGPQVTPGMEVTKPPLFFWWPYAFENWFGISSLLWVTIAFPLALLLVPFIDRTPLRHILDRKWIGLAALLVVLTWTALTIFVWLTPVAQHLGE